MWANSPSAYHQPYYGQNNRQSMMSDTYSVSSHHSANAGTMTNNTQYNPQYHQILSPAPPQQQTPINHLPSLTNILLNNSPGQFQAATQHPFLRLAGLGQLPKHVLSRWLSQDRLYAQAYIGFIGSLLSRVDLPYVFINDKSSSLRWRIVNMLTNCLNNINRELDFFTTTAHKYGLDLQAPLRPGDSQFAADTATKQYIDLFRAFLTDPTMSLLEGLVVLWATETVYLRAWSYAASYLHAPYTTETSSPPPRPPLPSSRTSSHYSFNNNTTNYPPAPNSNYAPSQADSEGPIPVLSAEDLPTQKFNSTNNNITTTTLNRSSFHSTTNPHSPNPASNLNPSLNPNNDLDGGALRHEFIPNWTSQEFEAFVREIAEVTDELASREDGLVRRLDVYKAVWRHILDVESRFWPNVDG
jgi:thiaminase